MLSKGGLKDIEQLFRLTLAQWKRMMDLELVQSWEGFEEEVLRWSEHSGVDCSTQAAEVFGSSGTGLTGISRPRKCFLFFDSAVDTVTDRGWRS